MTPFPDPESDDVADTDPEFEATPEHDPQPAPQFRDDLQRALAQTHRQQAARRTLGAHVSDYAQALEEQRGQRRTLSVLASVLMLLAWIWWRSRQKQ